MESLSFPSHLAAYTFERRECHVQRAWSRIRTPLYRLHNQQTGDEQAVVRASRQQQGEEQVSSPSDTVGLRPELFGLACPRFVDGDVVHHRGHDLSPHLQPLPTRSAPRGRASAGQIA